MSRTPEERPAPAVFLDRDGVINQHRPNYVLRLSDLSVYPQALEALARLATWPGKIVVVTNQSPVGRGLISMERMMEINRHLLAHIRDAGGRVDGLFVCPHAPHVGCACRKPRPGLLLQATEVLSIDLSRSVLIGDSLSDLQAGKAAGLRQTALVRTGRGRQQAQSAQAGQLQPFLIFDDLAEALEQMAVRGVIARGPGDAPAQTPNNS